jgi:hypothetical protein
MKTNTDKQTLISLRALLKHLKEYAIEKPGYVSGDFDIRVRSHGSHRSVMAVVSGNKHGLEWKVPDKCPK